MSHTLIEQYLTLPVMSVSLSRRTLRTPALQWQILFSAPFPWFFPVFRSVFSRPVAGWGSRAARQGAHPPAPPDPAPSWRGRESAGGAGRGAGGRERDGRDGGRERLVKDRGKEPRRDMSAVVRLWACQGLPTAKVGKRRGEWEVWSKWAMKPEAEGQQSLTDRAEISPKGFLLLETLIDNRIIQIYGNMYHTQSFTAVGYLGLQCTKTRFLMAF